MRIAEQIKRFLAAVVLLCFFLPLAQCSSKESASIAVQSNKPITEVIVPANDIKFQSLDELPIVAMYLWPLAFIFIRAKAMSRRAIALVSLAEIAIGGLVLFCIVQTIRFWGAVRYGGIMVITAHMAYLVAASITLYEATRKLPSSKP